MRAPRKQLEATLKSISELRKGKNSQRMCNLACELMNLQAVATTDADRAMVAIVADEAARVVQAHVILEKDCD